MMHSTWTSLPDSYEPLELRGECFLIGDRYQVGDLKVYFRAEQKAEITAALKPHELQRFAIELAEDFQKRRELA